jgi:hypothetical protein
MGPGLAVEIGRLQERVRVRISSDFDAAALIAKTLRETTGKTDVAKLTTLEGDRFQMALAEIARNIPAKGFTRADADPFVPIKIGFPGIWPQTATQPMVLKMDFLLSEDADREQSNYLGGSDEEQKEASYHYDCKMISLLSTRVPEGFVDFPEIEHDEQGRPSDVEALRSAIFDYFYVADNERSKALRFVARRIMARYWSKIVPTDYL